MKKPIENHEGIQFASITEMCEFHNIARATYVRRISRGWSKKNALVTPVCKHMNNKIATLSEKERQRKYNKSYYKK